MLTHETNQSITGILGRSVLYVISFLLLGIGTLAFFLFVSFCIVVWFRYLIRLSCECDLWQPQYIIISGILLILLFALMFRYVLVRLLITNSFSSAHTTLKKHLWYNKVRGFRNRYEQVATVTNNTIVGRVALAGLERLKENCIRFTLG